MEVSRAVMSKLEDVTVGLTLVVKEMALEESSSI